MANGAQIRHAIDEAVDRVVEHGTQGASQTDLILAGFAYLADHIQRINPPLSKRLISVGIVSGGIIAGLIEGMIRFA